MDLDRHRGLCQSCTLLSFHSLIHILMCGIQVRRFYRIPSLRAPHFISQKSLLTQLEKLFQHPSPTSSPCTVVLIGMGGAGKTQLALEYCRHLEDLKTHQAIFWLDASSHGAIYAAMETIAKKLWPERELKNSDVALTLVRDTLSNRSDAWLLVFDNLDRPSDLKGIMNFFQRSTKGSILITSRYAGSDDLGQAMKLDKMEMNECLQLLLPSEEVDSEQHSAAEEIVRRFGYLPLAIDQARAYIKRRKLHLGDFLAEYEKRKKNIMKEIPSHWQYQCRLLDMEEETSLNLFTTWEMSLDLLGFGTENSQRLKDVLTLFAFFHPVSISEWLFKTRGKELKRSPMSIFYDDDNEWDHLEFRDAIAEMQELSLLQFSTQVADEIAVSLHSMVSQWLQVRLDKSFKTKFFELAVLHMQSYL
jgi:hypothetical protein